MRYPWGLQSVHLHPWPAANPTPHTLAGLTGYLGKPVGASGLHAKSCAAAEERGREIERARVNLRSWTSPNAPCFVLALVTPGRTRDGTRPRSIPARRGCEGALVSLGNADVSSSPSCLQTEALSCWVNYRENICQSFSSNCWKANEALVADL